jgi:hypothetical protein
MMSHPDDQIDWSLTTWKGSRLRQHREYLTLPFRRKLELIEEMCERSRYLQKKRLPQPPSSGDKQASIQASS